MKMSRKQPFWTCPQRSSGYWRCRTNWTRRNGSTRSSQPVTIAPQLNTLLTDVEDIPRINELARSLQELKASGQLTKFKAVVGATQCETLDDVFDRIEKLSQYCFETKICDKDALVRDELEFVLGGKDADLIYKHLNREAYAEDVLKQYGAEITPYGMVNRADFGPLHEPISEQQQEQMQEQQMGM